MEVFVWILIAFAWVAWQIIQRALKPPKPLGPPPRDEGVPPAGETPPQSPPDVEWGRVRSLPPRTAPRQVDPPAAVEHFVWEQHAAQSEVAAARAMGVRQQARRLRQAQQQRPRRHPRRPLLHTQDGLRDAVVAAAVVGPCRALEPYQPPG